MSDSQAYEAITVDSEGVTVTKRFEADEFPVPAIAFQFASERDEAVTVRLSDVVPDGVEVEDLGFHPEYGSEFWTIQDDEITFERELESQGEYTTVYGIRATGSDNVEQFLTEPTIENVDPPLGAAEEELVEEGSAAVEDVIAEDEGSGGESILDEAQDDASEEDDVATLELNEPGPESSGESGNGAVATTGSVVAAIADEIRNNEAEPEDVKVLEDALDAASGPSGSAVAKVEKLQSDVDEVLAYTDALEEFLDDNGTAEQVIGDLEDRIDDLSEDLETAASTAEANREKLDSVAAELETLDDTIASLEDEVESIEGGSDEDVEARLDEIDEDIEQLKGWREQLSSVIGGEE